MDLQSLMAGVQIFLLAGIPALLGMICHEVAHGFVAWRLGDPTAKLMGRLTLNPIKHIDPTGLGVFIFTAVASALGGTRFIFGWAKPVPVQSRYFSNPRLGMLFVAVAGPLTNFMLALLCAFFLRMVMGTLMMGVDPSLIQMTLIKMLAFGIWINCVLAVFNLLPIPPLDGSHVLTAFLPNSLANMYWGLGRYSMLLVIVLIMSGVLSSILVPSVIWFAKFFSLLVGLDPNLVFIIFM